MAAALVAAALLSVPAFAQRETLAERVARLEQQLATGGDADSRQTLADLVFEMNQLQAEVRDLRGMVEDLGFELENLREAQRDQYLDLDRRLSGLSGSGTQTSGQRPADSGFSRRTVVRSPSGTVGDEPLTSPAPTDSAPGGGEPVTLTEDELPEVREEIDAGLETSGLGRAQSADVAPIADPMAEKQAYDEAFDSLKNGRYAEASRQFSSFVERYPSSEYADNAQYWLGESYYVTRNYRVALDTFQKLISQFPDSAKVPDAQLKIGLSYYSMQNWEAAEQELERVVETYPGTTPARLAQNRLRTMRIEGYIE
ncbi:MAG: tol-pal system protein YbgF [Xanthomonadales bacterium]|nr:tol-pal system protein YbgF [Xanthomonadales bacterium]